MTDRIYLLGFMGSGKSYSAKVLSQALNWQYLDLDSMIEDKIQMSIDQFFAKHGEKAFRVIEKDVLHSTKNLTQIVVATGGGTVCFFDNLQWINQHGLSVFLNPPVDCIIERLSDAKEIKKRPLLHKKSPEDLESYIRNVLKERLVYYRGAKLTFEQESIEDLLNYKFGA